MGVVAATTTPKPLLFHGPDDIGCRIGRCCADAGRLPGKYDGVFGRLIAAQVAPARFCDQGPGSCIAGPCVSLDFTPGAANALVKSTDGSTAVSGHHDITHHAIGSDGQGRWIDPKPQSDIGRHIQRQQLVSAKRRRCRKRSFLPVRVFHCNLRVSAACYCQKHAPPSPTAPARKFKHVRCRFRDRAQEWHLVASRTTWQASRGRPDPTRLGEAAGAESGCGGHCAAHTGPVQSGQ